MNGAVNVDVLMGSGGPSTHVSMSSEAVASLSGPGTAGSTDIVKFRLR